MNLGKNIRRIAEQADGLRLACFRPSLDHRQRIVKRVRTLVHIAGAQAKIDALGITLNREAGRAGKYRRQRLRAAHAAKPGR